MPAENTLDLPALSIQALEESPAHLAPVLRGRPAARFSPAFDGDKAVGFEFIADEAVEIFRVATAIPQHAPETNAPVGFAQHGGSLQGVARGSQVRVGADKQVGFNIDASREFGPARRMKAVFSPMRTVVKRNLASLESSAIPGDLRPLGDQFVLARNLNRGLQQALEVQFFKRRCSALHSAE